MTHTAKKDLERELLLTIREYGINAVLYRNAVGERIGVTVSDMECLGLLFHKGIATPTELAKLTGLSSGSTTAMLDRLERARLIKRRPNPHDRRGVFIEVNQSGAKKVATYFIEVRAAQDKLLADCTAAELRLLINVFHRLDEIYLSQLQRVSSATSLKTRAG